MKKVLKVCKFGGTSLANSENIQRVVDIIKSDEARKIIVVSAPGKRSKDDTKITDLLLEIYDLSKNGKNFDRQYEQFRERFREIARVFECKTNLEEIMDEFYGEIRGANMDFIVSTGEYFMAKVLASILGYEFCDIDKTRVIVLGEAGEVDLALSRKNFAKFANKRIVVPGFYAVKPDGTIKTFPRGGSDISGAIIANIASATVYENFTDVDGVYDSDPNKHKDARKFDALSYDEIERMALDGANVLHPDCVKFARAKGIPIHIKNTFNPCASGTVIS